MSPGDGPQHPVDATDEARAVGAALENRGLDASGTDALSDVLHEQLDHHVLELPGCGIVAGGAVDELWQRPERVDPRGYDDVEVDLGVDGLISVAPSRLVSTGPRTVSTCTIEPP